MEAYFSSQVRVFFFDYQHGEFDIFVGNEQSFESFRSEKKKKIKF